MEPTEISDENGSVVIATIKTVCNSPNEFIPHSFHTLFYLNPFLLNSMEM